MNETKDNDWLERAEVHTLIEKESGRWHVQLVFFEKDCSQHYLVKYINNYPSKRLAEISAVNIKRTIDKNKWT